MESCENPFEGSTKKIPRKSPEIIYIEVGKNIPKQEEDPLTIRNFSVHLAAARENLLERSVPKNVPRNLPQRLAWIKHIAIRVDPWKHRRKALERLKPQQRLDRFRRPVDRLAALPPRDDFVHQRLVR